MNLQTSTSIQVPAALIEPGEHPRAAQTIGAHPREEYFGPRAVDEPHDQQASKPAASPGWLARREGWAAALMLGQPAASGLHTLIPSWMNEEEGVAWGHIWGVEEPCPSPSIASGGESMEPRAPFRSNLLLHPRAPAPYPLTLPPGTPLASAQGTPPAPAAQPGDLRDSSSQPWVARVPAALLAAPFLQGELPAAPFDYPLPEIEPYCPLSGPLVASLDTDVVDGVAVGDILLEIRQILLSLPTKADLQALLADITVSGDRFLGVEERDQGSSVARWAPALQGPQALSDLPTVLTPPEPKKVVVQPSEQLLPHSMADSWLPPIPRSWLIMTAIPYTDTPGDLGDREDSLGLVPSLSDTASSSRHLWGSGAERPLQQAVDGDLSPLDGSLGRALPIFLTTAVWNGDAPQSNLLKLREAGALYRWGPVFHYQIGPIRADGLKLLSLLSNGLPERWTDQSREPIWTWL